jgi:hypothetical protein
MNAELLHRLAGAGCLLAVSALTIKLPDVSDWGVSVGRFKQPANRGERPERPREATESPLLRFEWMAVFRIKEDSSPPLVKLISRRINDRPPHVGFQYKMVDESNRVFEHGFVKFGGDKEISLAGCPTELCLLQAKIPHGGIVESRTPYCFLASTEHPLRLTGRFDITFHFYVPEGCQQFEIAGECGPKRTLPMVIYDPEGGLATATAERDRRAWWQTWRVDVSEEFRGRTWAMDTRMTGDLRLKLEGDLPPLLALEPEWAGQIGKRIAASSGDAKRDRTETVP